MKIFALYTAARAGLFLACYGIIWLALGWWIEWDSVNALSTALLAMVVSSALALRTLSSLRGRFADEVAARAERAKAAFETARSGEDADDR